ncbi:MAG TPA: IPT/TIG domain-containing protein, partial [Candidatus Binatia bacterium]|nr:IPT/TIG domain-containing protein [Candidatus Binatia bacterium]
IRDAVMWPFLGSDTVGLRTPTTDDVAWLSHLYPAEPAASAAFGRIAGKVTNGVNGLPVLGAHVYAVDPATQAPVVGAYSNDDGTFVVPGLAPKSYLLAIEPLDGDPVGLEPFRVNEVVASTNDTSFPDEFRDPNEGAVEADATAFEVIPVTAGATAGGRNFVTNTLTLPGASARLLPGYNQFAWPLGVPAGATAFELLSVLGGPDVVASIDRYVPRTGAFQRAEHVNGVARGADFPLRSGEGYVVQMLQERLAGFTGGSDCPALDLAVGLNLIGVPCRPPGYTAFALLQDLGAAFEVDRIIRWDATAAQYRTARYAADGTPAGDDFPIERGEAYSVIMRAAKGGVRLPRAGRAITPQLTGLSPGRGVPGTVVAILGEGFDPDPAKNLVTFGGIPAAVIVASTTTLTAAVPGAASSGPVQATVGGRASNTLAFTIEPPVLQVPAEQTAELVSGQSAEATIDQDGEQDRYTFTALVGSVVTITAESLASGVPDLVLVLEDPYGAIAASDDNGGGGTNPRINNFVLTATGTHTIVVTNVPGSGTGGYRVKLAIATKPAETQLSILGGDNQTGEKGAALDDPLTIFATGPTGAPLAGVPVSYVATEVEVTGQSAGPIEAASVTVATNGSGIVSIQSVLPDKSGVFEIQVAVPGAKPVKFTVAAVTKGVTKVTTFGHDQTGEAGLPLSPFSVTLQDANGTPVAGALVSFQVVVGGGTLAPSGTQKSNALGTVQTIFTLGKHTFERQIVAAFVPGRSKPILFEATATAGDPKKIESSKSPFSRLTLGVTIKNALYVRVLDAFGNPVPFATIDYDTPPGIEAMPGVAPDGTPFTNYRTNDDGLHVAALEVPVFSNPSFPSDLASDAQPSIDELGAQRLPPYTITARVHGTNVQQTFRAHVDMGPRLVNDTQGSLSGPMGTQLPHTVDMRLVRMERVVRGGDGDFRNDDFSRMREVAVPGGAVHVSVARVDGHYEPDVGLQAMEPNVLEAITDASGLVKFTMTAGDVSGLVDVTGAIRKLHVVFANAKNVAADFEDPSALRQTSIVNVTGPKLLVNLTDSGSGIDLETIVAKLNGVAFFDGKAPPTLLPFFPDRLEITIGGRAIETLGPDLGPDIIKNGAFEHVILEYWPSRPKLKPTGNRVEVGPSFDRAGNPDPTTFVTEFPFP